MSEAKTQFHGSDLETIERIYHIPKENIISFSANVNPLGISDELRRSLASHIDVITSYPDREYTSLRECIAEYAHTDASHILVGNGSTELISLFIRIRQPKNALIFAPTYSEYEREIRLCGGSASYYALREEDNFVLDVSDFLARLTPDIDLLVLCNPNNPTSSAVTAAQMKRILEVCAEYDILVTVDETYVEFADSAEEITSVPLVKEFQNLIVLRGTSKFFAAPGLRLGYAVTSNEDLKTAFSSLQNPWSVHSLAVAAGEIMFRDTAYQKKTHDLISSERKRILNLLNESASYHAYPAYANFVLVKILSNNITSQGLFERAIKEGLMIRDCSSFPLLGEKYIRFCFMKPEDNDKLLNCLSVTHRL